MIDRYKAIIETMKDSSDAGKGVIVIGLIAVASISAIKNIILKPNEHSQEIT